MRTFESLDGERWSAEVEERTGPNYKGRLSLLFRREADGMIVRLTDVRWNGRSTAERSIASMADIELKKRLRSAFRREGSAGTVAV